MDAEGRIIDYHAPQRSDLLHSPDYFLGRHVHEILPPDVAQLIESNLATTLGMRQIRSFEYELEFSPDNNRSYEARMVPAGDSEAIAVVRDVTESKRIEEQMRKLQKVEAVGRLAGGIAHDFNNLLTIINGYSELLLKRLAPEDSMLPALTAVRDAGRRAAKLVRQLLAFSREQVMRPELLDVNNVVVQIQPLMPRTSRSRYRTRAGVRHADQTDSRRSRPTGTSDHELGDECPRRDAARRSTRHSHFHRWRRRTESRGGGRSKAG